MDEYELIDGSDRSSSTSVTTTTEAELFDPYKYMLKHVYVKRALSSMPLEMKIVEMAPGVVQVAKVKTGGVASQLGIQPGWFLLTVNGRRATGRQEDLSPDRDGIRMAFAVRRRVPLNPEAPNSFLWRYRPPEDCTCHIIRLNMLQCKPSALKFIVGRGRRPCIAPGSDRKAMEEAGFRIGDKVLVIDGVSVREKGHCDMLLNSGREVIDFVVERKRPVVKPPPPTNGTPETVAISDFSLSTDDDKPNAVSTVNVSIINFDDYGEMDEWFAKEPVVMPGDPSVGVPKSVPNDVARIAGFKSPDFIRKLTTAKTQSSSQQQPSPQQHRAKVVKVVDKAKLKKDKQEFHMNVSDQDQSE